MDQRTINNLTNLIKTDDVQILQKFLEFEKNIDLNEYYLLDGKNLTFLGYAIINESVQVAKILVENGASLDCYIGGDTVPIFIARYELKPAYPIIIMNLFDDTLLTFDGLDSFFSLAIKNNDNYLINSTKNSIDVNVVNSKNQSLLWFAAAKSNAELVHFLIKKGADPYVEDNEGKAPIHWIVKHDIKLRNYDVNYVDEYGNNFLMIALIENNIELAHFILIDYDDFKFSNKIGISVLELIIKKLDSDFIKFLYMQRPEIFLNLKKMQTIASNLIKKKLDLILINILIDYEDRININKIIKACIENDNVHIFNYIKESKIMEFEEEYGIFEEIIQNNAKNILIHLMNQRIFLNKYLAKEKTIMALVKILGNQEMTKMVNYIKHNWN